MYKANIALFYLYDNAKCYSVLSSSHFYTLFNI